jgi:predicted GH43/DUF377 family glycosyl hydrolase
LDERDGNEHYTTKAALLDDETGRVKSVLPEPIMRPELDWERAGDVNNVVFPCGYSIGDDGDTLYMYYGAADSCIGLATASVHTLLEWLKRNSQYTHVRY